MPESARCIGTNGGASGVSPFFLGLIGGSYDLYDAPPGGTGAGGDLQTFEFSFYRWTNMTPSALQGFDRQRLIRSFVAPPQPYVLMIEIYIRQAGGQPNALTMQHKGGSGASGPDVINLFDPEDFPQDEWMHFALRANSVTGTVYLGRHGRNSETLATTTKDVMDNGDYVEVPFNGTDVIPKGFSFFGAMLPENITIGAISNTPQAATRAWLGGCCEMRCHTTNHAPIILDLVKDIFLDTGDPLVGAGLQNCLRFNEDPISDIPVEIVDYGLRSGFFEDFNNAFDHNQDTHPFAQLSTDFVVDLDDPTLAVSDARIVDFTKSIFELVVPAEVFTVGYFSNFEEGVTKSDILDSAALGMSIEREDTVEPFDEVFQEFINIELFSDEVNPTDALQVQYQANFVETVVPSEVFVEVEQQVEVFLDTVIPTEANESDFFLARSDNTAVADEVLAALGMNIDLADTVTPSDAIVEEVVLQPDLVFEPLDVFVHTKTVVREFTENLVLPAELLTVDLSGELDLSLADQLILLEDFVRPATFIREFADSVEPADAVDSDVARFADLTDNVTPADDHANVVTFDRSEAQPVSENFLVSASGDVFLLDPVVIPLEEIEVTHFIGSIQHEVDLVEPVVIPFDNAAMAFMSNREESAPVADAVERTSTFVRSFVDPLTPFDELFRSWTIVREYAEDVTPFDVLSVGQTINLQETAVPLEAISKEIGMFVAELVFPTIDNRILDPFMMKTDTVQITDAIPYRSLFTLQDLVIPSEEVFINFFSPNQKPFNLIGRQASISIIARSF